jgi:hypothetical protein
MTVAPGTAALALLDELAPAAGEALEGSADVAAAFCAIGADEVPAAVTAASGGASAAGGNEVVPMPFVDGSDGADLMSAAAIESGGRAGVVCGAAGAATMGAVATVAPETTGAGGCWSWTSNGSGNAMTVGVASLALLVLVVPS